ncbi:MAG TPA: 1-phosphofructokinase family hexose kinase [Intrasporangium sp.]|uniref:1-phosphofructokinase family hexose kinase n=1 Tax=Intrasporangium sp. TaxID=1925024 RepID=UPI002D772C7E|nr:1-phosphofructokinase family hexose kinase [Intrasporangium sp.]HET7397342.1 1-phosphofructokinase family hexose kinase [Intrasporangium sp.]
MIVTVTLNPSLDLTYALGEAPLGEVDVHRAETSSLEASGKGVNVSRALHLAGVATVAVFPAGGQTGRHVGDLLAAAGVEHVAVPVQGETRINTSLLLGSGQTVKVNGPGTPLARADVETLLGTLETVLTGVDRHAGESWLALCGSLPPGMAPDVVGEFVHLAHRYAVRCAVDVSGPALRAALRAKADLLAPNRLELGELVGADMAAAGIPAVAEAAGRLAADYGTELLVSLGSDGAVHTDGIEALHGSGPALVAVNTAGAGDAFLAGWLAVPGAPRERMARALAWGRSACLSATTVDPAPGTRGVDGITVSTINQRVKGIPS